ncbi:MAG TPA: trypsin-like peptidase domain-containing protein [Gemmatimonadaceae bacterium]|nr:trypsin-like peptidase domain-containing protein [Gemmatimonadaceae bacterium]
MKARTVAVVVGLLVGVGIGVTLGVAGRDSIELAQAQASATVTSSEEVVIRVAREITPAVVSVSTGSGSGSGVFIAKEGVIITNAHVVQNAPQVRIGLADGRMLDGQVLGRDPLVDVAVVRVAIQDAPTAPLGDSDRLQVGQQAIAVGNPLGLERSVTTGVVSAINRSPRGLGLEGLIQTDAAISVGNSGGPLVDSQGRVIGINTAVFSGPGVAGLGFAVPINLARDIAQQVLTTGRITRAFLGISYGDIEPELARQFGLPVQQGIIVLGVAAGSPAHRGGIRPQDIIVGMNDVEIEQGGDLRRALRDLSPGDEARLTIVRPSGRMTVTVRLSEAPTS